MAAKKENEIDEKITLTYSDLQSLIAAELAKHEADKNKKTEETEEQKKLRDHYNEKVVINLFLDNDKYRDDLIVNVNGKAWQIKRGVNVEVPRYVAEVIENSLKQDRATALHITELENNYQNA